VIAHVGGLPIEETLGSLGPALLLAFGAVSATLRARLRRVRCAAGAHTPRARRRAQRGRAGLDSNRDERAALRWLARFCVERREATLGEVQAAARAVENMADQPTVALDTLRRLCSPNQARTTRPRPPPPGRARPFSTTQALLTTDPTDRARTCAVYGAGQRSYWLPARVMASSVAVRALVKRLSSRWP
jgi:hypothetical protein